MSKMQRRKGYSEENWLTNRVKEIDGWEAKRVGNLPGTHDIHIWSPKIKLVVECKFYASGMATERQLAKQGDVVIGNGFAYTRGQVLFDLLEQYPNGNVGPVGVSRLNVRPSSALTRFIGTADILWHRVNNEAKEEALVVMRREVLSELLS